MSYENAAAEVAEDFKTALEDMASISRIEIMNLCQIARENTEHAFEISEVLVAHINRTAPQKKLAALYVLDAIVKNVGTPYTLYVAPKLFSTFMEAYARVEHPVRRKMEEMLKTWKGPVPGSMDTKPVFPPDVVKPIENALIKAHTSAMQTLQQHRKTQPHILGRPPPGVPHRNTPTPPGMPHGAHGHPYTHHATPDANGTGTPQHQAPPFVPPRSGTQSMPPTHGAHPYYGAPQQPGYVAGVNADVLNKDIEDLVLATRVEYAQNPHDGSVPTRLKALMDLQAIVQAKNLPQDQLVLVKKQVDELAVKMRVPQVGSSTTSSTPNHQHQHHVSLAASVAPPPSTSSAGTTLVPLPLAQVPTPVPTASAPVPAQQPSQGHVTIDSLLGKGALAALLAQQAEQSARSTPAPAPPAIHTPPHPPPAMPAAAPQTAQDPMALIHQLRQAGLLGAAGHTTAPVAPPPAPAAPSIPTPAMQSAALASLPPVLARVLSPMKAWAPPPPLIDSRELSWNLASLQVVRPYLFPALYGELGPQCSQCGRRFKADAEGKKKKTAHMDWHFRVRQRMAEAEKRGQYRSHYVPKHDWIKSREEVDLDYSAEEKDTTTSEEASKPPEQQYIRVPDPSSGISKVCPICQEQFENKWLDSAQEWVWLDAKMVGNRAYHASCHAEATKDRDRATTPSFGGGGRGFTPEPVLGKRKADVSADSKTLKKGRS